MALQGGSAPLTHWAHICMLCVNIYAYKYTNVCFSCLMHFMLKVKAGEAGSHLCSPPAESSGLWGAGLQAEGGPGGRVSAGRPRVESMGSWGASRT